MALDHKHINAKCRLLLGAFFSLNCVVLSYGAFFLKSNGFPAKTIGLLIACASLAGGLLQPVAGRIADRSERWYWRSQMLVYGIAELCLMLLLTFVRNRVCEGLLFGLAIVMVMLMMPMVNASSFYYTARGIKVDFGAARGIGSLVFAVVSLVVGRVAKAKGSTAVPVIGMIFCALLLAAAFIMPRAGGAVQRADDKPAAVNTDRKAFIGKYPLFITMAAAMGMVLVLHNLVNTYFVDIIENVGGDVADLGRVLGICAVAEIPVMVLYSRFTKKTGVSAEMLIVAACGFFAARGLLYSIAKSIGAVYAVSLLQSVSYGLLTAAKASYAYETMEPEDATLGQSVMTMTDVFGSVVGSLVGGALISAGGIRLTLGFGWVVALLGTFVALFAMLGGKKRG